MTLLAALLAITEPYFPPPRGPQPGAAEALEALTDTCLGVFLIGVAVAVLVVFAMDFRRGRP